ncbi:phosphohydrolase [Candidatus Nomurabacteria bacterium]|nr:phosphohydrolase [Candidatus Nomurabacteria bacterium]MCB9803944.1 phosphohydrolase [Candidatus Nomurabacteria bacterium]
MTIIKKYISEEEQLYDIYMSHVERVADRAVVIAQRIGLSRLEQEFIYDAGMLHDIGVVEVYAPDIGCNGGLPYIQHLIVGKRILDEEGMPHHGNVALRHCSPKFTMDNIKRRKIPLPEGNYLPQNIYEIIISYADLFYTKNPCYQGKCRCLEEVLPMVDRYEKGSSDEVYEYALEFGELFLPEL